MSGIAYFGTSFPQLSAFWLSAQGEADFAPLISSFSASAHNEVQRAPESGWLCEVAYLYLTDVWYVIYADILSYRFILWNHFCTSFPSSSSWNHRSRVLHVGFCGGASKQWHVLAAVWRFERRWQDANELEKNDSRCGWLRVLEKTTCDCFTCADVKLRRNFTNDFDTSFWANSWTVMFLT